MKKVLLQVMIVFACLILVLSKDKGVEISKEDIITQLQNIKKVESEDSNEAIINFEATNPLITHKTNSHWIYSEDKEYGKTEVYENYFGQEVSGSVTQYSEDNEYTYYEVVGNVLEDSNITAGKYKSDQYLDEFYIGVLGFVEFAIDGYLNMIFTSESVINYFSNASGVKGTKYNNHTEISASLTKENFEENIELANAIADDLYLANEITKEDLEMLSIFNITIKASIKDNVIQSVGISLEYADISEESISQKLEITVNYTGVKYPTFPSFEDYVLFGKEEVSEYEQNIK